MSTENNKENFRFRNKKGNEYRLPKLFYFKIIISNLEFKRLNVHE